MSRIAARFAELKRQGRGALIPYLEAFDPDYATSAALLHAMPDAGADLIEIGMPFSDPSADGPTIQEAAIRGLKAGATLARTLEMVADFRKTDAHTPIILMGYLNPIDTYGPQAFCEDAHRAGVDGLIIVDLPPEEADLLSDHAAANELDLIRLIAPNTTEHRLQTVLEGASGFLYYVSITGITGTNTASAAQLEAALPKIRAHTNLPIAIGFGITTPEQARTAARIGDAAVVASTLIKTLARTLHNGHPTEHTIPAVTTEIKALAHAIRTPDTMPRARLITIAGLAALLTAPTSHARSPGPAQPPTRIYANTCQTPANSIIAGYIIEITQSDPDPTIRIAWSEGAAPQPHDTTILETAIPETTLAFTAQIQSGPHHPTAETLTFHGHFNQNTLIGTISANWLDTPEPVTLTLRPKPDAYAPAPCLPQPA